MRHLLIALAFVPTAAGAQALPEKTPLAEAELAEQRGAFRLPNGMEITIGVATQTRVDGRTVLSTTYNVAGGAPQFRVQAGSGNDPNGTSEVVPTAGGVSTRDGVVQMLPNGVRFSGDAIQVTHLAGQAFGTVLANSGSNRAIDMQTTVDIHVTGITPDMLGSSALRIEGLALDATARLTR